MNEKSKETGRAETRISDNDFNNEVKTIKDGFATNIKSLRTFEDFFQFMLGVLQAMLDRKPSKDEEMHYGEPGYPKVPTHSEIDGYHHSDASTTDDDNCFYEWELESSDPYPDPIEEYYNPDEEYDYPEDFDYSEDDELPLEESGSSENDDGDEECGDADGYYDDWNLSLTEPDLDPLEECGDLNEEFCYPETIDISGIFVSPKTSEECDEPDDESDYPEEEDYDDYEEPDDESDYPEDEDYDDYGEEPCYFEGPEITPKGFIKNWYCYDDDYNYEYFNRVSRSAEAEYSDIAMGRSRSFLDDVENDEEYSYYVELFSKYDDYNEAYRRDLAELFGEDDYLENYCY